MQDATVRHCCCLAAFSAAIALMIPATPAAAQDTRAAAVQLFDAGQALLQQGKVAEACPKFAESYRLDPQLGALLHYADCLEQAVKLASAYAAFRDAAEVAQEKGDDRKTLAEERARALEARVSRLTIEFAPAARVPGLEVLRDGTPVSEATFGVPIPVDGGRHSVVARAPGYKPITINVALRNEAENHRVVVPGLEAENAASQPAPAAAPAPTSSPAAAPQAAPAAAPPARQDTPPPAQESQGVPTVTLVTGGVAVLGLALGITFNVMAQKANDDAKRACTNGSGGDFCTVADEDAKTDRESKLDSARSNATLSYVSFGVAGAAALTAVITLVASKSSSSSNASLKLAPAVGTRAGGLSLRGSF